MLTVHLTASAFFGGPERQMLDLAKAMPADYRTAFLLFRERGGSLDFQQRLDESGFESHILDHDTPRLPGMIGEVATRLRGMSADVLCPHGYKAHIVGLLAARRAGIPVVAVCRGWTSDTWK